MTAGKIGSIMTHVKIEGLTKRYPNGFEAVTDLHLDVKPGELIALVGPSGCGKSTTLRMIAGLEEISEGTLLINGERANDLPPKARQIGMVFQSYALYPHMTVRENIAFGLTLQKLPKDEIDQRVERVSKKLQIHALLDRKPKQMSGGQRQRVAMARAVARQPSIFLFDEPLSNLDAQLRAEMRIEINKLQKEMKATSFYVTHDQVEAMTLADRVVLLRDGQVQQIGPPLELHDRPENRFVATFIGSPTMNLINVELTKNGLSLLGRELLLPSERYDALINAGLNTGSSLDLGIRPHQLEARFNEEGNEKSEELKNGDLWATVEFVEPLGSETICYCFPDISSGDQPSTKPIVLKVSSEVKINRGQRLILKFKPEHLHLFSADEKGERLPG